MFSSFRADTNHTTPYPLPPSSFVLPLPPLTPLLIRPKEARRLIFCTFFLLPVFFFISLTSCLTFAKSLVIHLPRVSLAWTFAGTTISPSIRHVSKLICLHLISQERKVGGVIILCLLFCVCLSFFFNICSIYIIEVILLTDFSLCVSFFIILILFYYYVTKVVSYYFIVNRHTCD